MASGILGCLEPFGRSMTISELATSCSAAVQNLVKCRGAESSSIGQTHLVAPSLRSRARRPLRGAGCRARYADRRIVGVIVGMCGVGRLLVDAAFGQGRELLVG